MKKYILSLSITFLAMTLFSSCADKLTEENHQESLEKLMKTPDGFIMGLNSTYTVLRGLYGSEDSMHGLMNPGTDEMKAGSGSNMPTPISNYDPVKYTTNDAYPKKLWKNAYLHLNTLNFLIQYGPDIEENSKLTPEKKKQYIGEAKFLRAFLYFNLVQQFGDVTLNTTYNTTPSRTAKRDDMLDVYEVIIQDLKDAVADCSPSPQMNGLESGRVSGATARHLLSRVYLTLGWVHDKSGSNSSYANNPHVKYYDAQKAQEYYKLAYNTATQLINDAPSLGISLMPEYADVFNEKNDAPSLNNKETLMVARFDWDDDNTYGDRTDLNQFYVNGYEAFLGERNINDGRCYSWTNPNTYTFNTFNNRDKDTRYGVTFQTVWYATKKVISDKAGSNGDFEVSYKIDGVSETFKWQQRAIGDTALYYPGYKMSANEIRAKTQNRGTDKNKYVIIATDGYDGSKNFPTMMKYLDRTRNHYNDRSDRSVTIFRFAETYLLAAEAAFKMNKNSDAATYINFVRDRARNKATTTAGGLNITAADITLDFVLEERTRELLAEHCRWTDLVRTGTLIDRVKKYDDRDAKNNIDIIPGKNWLRPIPLEQIKSVQGEPYPQNPGW